MNWEMFWVTVAIAVGVGVFIPLLYWIMDILYDWFGPVASWIALITAAGVGLGLLVGLAGATS